MTPILWVVIIVGIAILQLSQAKGRTELQGAPFENEKDRDIARTPARTHGDTPNPRSTGRAPVNEIPKPENAPRPAEVKSEQSVLKDSPSISLMQAIVLSEILGPPRAKQTRRRR